MKQGAAGLWAQRRSTMYQRVGPYTANTFNLLNAALLMLYKPNVQPPYSLQVKRGCITLQSLQEAVQHDMQKRTSILSRRLKIDDIVDPPAMRCILLLLQTSA